MFLGEYQYTIDDKGRLTIPAKFRPPLLQGMVITRGMDRNLAIYPLDAWSELVDRIEGLAISDPQARNLRRLLFSGASDLAPDKQGRVNIPSYLLEYGRITKDVVVVGVNKYIELWSPDQWDLVRAALEDETSVQTWANLGI